MKSKRHVNIPVFIPHLGCPNMCVFCNQRTISGKESFDIAKVTEDIEAVLSTCERESSEIELAFFGGSFTGIDRELMLSLLKIGKDYLDKGKIDSMRCSTRPDYIDDEILSILSQYGMGTVELGIQSMDNSVLFASRRGHSAQKTIEACKAIIDAGFSLVGQMMIGLPGASGESECECARFIADSGAKAARVYPTVVFKDTELASMAKDKSYIPLDNSEAVIRTKNVLDIFDREGIKVIRVGLCASENLSDTEQVYGGVSDSAIGEKAMSALFLERIEALIDKTAVETRDRTLIISAPFGSVSKIVGQRKKNKEILLEKYGFKSIKILEKSEFIGYNVIIDII